MASAVTPVGNNPFQPGMVSETYIPDQLIAGDLKLVTTSGTIGGGAVLNRGQIMAQVTATAVWVAWNSAASDGSQNPLGVLVDRTDASQGNVTGGIYLMGEFNGAYTTPSNGAALNPAVGPLRDAGIFIKTQVVTASDPS